MHIIVKRILPIGVFAALGLGARAQSLLGGAEFSAKLPHRFTVSAGVEYRTTDWFDHSSQWSVEAGAAYKPVKPLKIAVAYSFIQANTLAGLNSKGYYMPDYWVNKHRVGVSVTGQWKPSKKFTLSLRERYQYTYRPSLLVPQFDEGKPYGNKTINEKSKHMLRSRLEVEYKPYKKCRWEPYAQFELYSLLSDVNHTKHRTEGGKFCDKYRVTVGCEYSINKNNDVSLFYRYADTTDPDEMETHHTIGLVYSFSL